MKGVLMMSDIVQIIVNNGVAVGVVTYFLYRDYKYNADMVVMLHDIKTLVEIIRGEIDSENK